MIANANPQYTHPLVSERAIDEPRPLKVAYIGAGMAGVIAGILLPQCVPGIDLTIYEKNDDVGGTWFENTYPGCACDVPAHTYQLSFEPNVAWSKFYVPAEEIQAYWSRVADKYNVRQLIKFKHRLIEARWDNDRSKWHLKFKNLANDQIIEDTADALIAASGILNDWKWPDIKGLHDFKGKLLHSAKWDATYDAKDKNVAVIGCGSSGIQLVAALQKQVKHMDHYVRSSTWISTSYGHDFVRPRNEGEDGNFSYTADEISTWKSNPDTYLAYRNSLELAMQKGYMVTHLESLESNGARQFFEAEMHRRLFANSSSPTASKRIASHLIPDFPPICRRLTPGPGYLEAITAANVTVIPEPISHITPTAIATTTTTTTTTSSTSPSPPTSTTTHREIDTIICATGFNTTHQNHHPPIYGRDPTTTLSDHYAAHGPESYLSLTLHSFPNFIQASGGPNSGHVTGDFPLYLERVHGYVGALLRRLSQSHVRTVEPRPEAVRAFTAHCDAFFERTVFQSQCSSWYRSPRVPGDTAGDTTRDSGSGGGNGGRSSERVTGLWPGSCLHAMKAMQEVRWEDYIVGVEESETGKACAWLGNGFVWDEVSGDDEGILKFLALHGDARESGFEGTS